jgi:hypothetical protein
VNKYNKLICLWDGLGARILYFCGQLRGLELFVSLTSYITRTVMTNIWTYFWSISFHELTIGKLTVSSGNAGLKINVLEKSSFDYRFKNQ